MEGSCLHYVRSTTIAGNPASNKQERRSCLALLIRKPATLPHPTPVPDATPRNSNGARKPGTTLTNFDSEHT
jgi:hypothetical protein